MIKQKLFLCTNLAFNSISMKVILPTVLFFSSILILQAQPVLTRATNAPQIGYPYVIQYALSKGVSITTTAANAIWDYSKLIDDTMGITADTMSYTPASTTQYASLFPTSNIVMTNNLEGRYDYYTITDSGFYNNGFVDHGAGYEDTVMVAPYRRLLKFPLTFGDNYTDSFVSRNITYPTDDNLQKDTVNADGYGTLILPGKIYSNVLRLSIKTTTTRLYYGKKYNSDEIMFLVPGYFYPILDIYTYYGNSIPDTFVTYAKNVNVLSLQFLSFDIQQRENAVVLQWKTAQETNTSHFIIQRCIDNNHFVEIGRQNAASFSNKVNDYSFTDESINDLSGGIVGYRLKEVDKDGKTTYSAIRTISKKGQNAITVSPNPSSSGQVNVIANHIQSISVFDISGRLMITEKIADKNKYKIDADKLSKGTYLIIVKTVSGKTFEQKLIIQ